MQRLAVVADAQRAALPSCPFQTGRSAGALLTRTQTNTYERKTARVCRQMPHHAPVSWSALISPLHSQHASSSLASNWTDAAIRVTSAGASNRGR